MKKRIVYLLVVLLITGCLAIPVSAAMSEIPEAGLSLEIPPDFDAYTPYSTDEEFANLWGLSREESIARMEETDYSLILRSPEHSVTMYFSVENTRETNFFSMTEEEFYNQAEDFLMRNKEVTADPVAVGVVVTDDSRWVYGVFDVPEGDSVRYFTVHNKMLYTVLGTNTMVVSQPLEVWQVDLMSDILKTAIYVPVKEVAPSFAPVEEMPTERPAEPPADTAPQKGESAAGGIPSPGGSGAFADDADSTPSYSEKETSMEEYEDSKDTQTDDNKGDEKTFPIPLLIGIGVVLILAATVPAVVFSVKKKKRSASTPASVSLPTTVSPEEYIFCSRCGTKLPQRAKFCPNCGKKTEP